MSGLDWVKIQARAQDILDSTDATSADSDTECAAFVVSAIALSQHGQLSREEFLAFAELLWALTKVRGE